MSQVNLPTALAIAALTIPVTIPGLAGCRSDSAAGTRGAILEQWNQRISGTGLVAIAPPEEDLRVGDIFAFSISPDLLADGSAATRQAAARRVSASSRWAALPVLSDLGVEYAARPSWPRTPDAFVGRPGEMAGWAESGTDGVSIFNPEQLVTRLRMVGLDQFAAVSFTGSDLETVIPTEAATLIAGNADPRSLAVTLRAGSAESYALSMDSVIGLLLDDASGDGAAGYVVKPAYRRNLDLVADPVSHRVWLQVISEVVYVRSADITIRTFDAEPAKEQVTAEELAVVATRVQPSSPAPADQAASDAAYAATKLDPLYGAFVRAQAINDVLAQSVGDDVPGSLVHFISVTDESVALRRLWPRGLAIGVRGLTLEIDARTGRVLRSGPMGQPLPYRRATAAGSSTPGI